MDVVLLKEGTPKPKKHPYALHRTNKYVPTNLAEKNDDKLGVNITPPFVGAFLGGVPVDTNLYIPNRSFAALIPGWFSSFLFNLEGFFPFPRRYHQGTCEWVQESHVHHPRWSYHVVRRHSSESTRWIHIHTSGRRTSLTPVEFPPLLVWPWRIFPVLQDC